MIKKFKIKITAAFLLIISLFSLSTVTASNTSVPSETKVNTVIKLGIFKGDTDGNLRLEDRIIRSELITAFIRTTGLENNIDQTDFNISFSDLSKSHWSYKYIGTALKNGLIAGYPDNTVGPDRFITYSEALTLILRILGYHEAISTGSWPSNVIDKCYELGIIDNKSDLPGRQISRKEVAMLIYNSLSVNIKN